MTLFNTRNQLTFEVEMTLPEINVKGGFPIFAMSDSDSIEVYVLYEYINLKFR